MGDQLRVLWLTADLPGSAPSGRVAYSMGLARALGAAGASVSILGVGDASVELPAWHGVTWQSVQASRRPRVLTLFGRLPSMAYSVRSAALRTEVTRMIQSHQWDSLVVDHVQMAWTIEGCDKSARAPAIVYASQNSEASLRVAVAKSVRKDSKLKGTLLARDARKSAQLEAAVVERAQVITTVTQADATDLAETYQVAPERFLLLPPGYDGKFGGATPPLSQRPRRAVILGNFEWHVKQRNLERLLDAIDPMCSAAGIGVDVVGFVPARVRQRWSQRYQSASFSGVCPDLATAFGRARIALVSEPVGGGFKLKCLDFIANGLPIMTVEGSMEGLPLRSGEHLMSYANESALGIGLRDEIDHPERLEAIADGARVVCAGKFSWASRGQSMLAALTSCL